MLIYLLLIRKIKCIMNQRLIELEQKIGVSLLAKIDEPFITEQGLELWLKRDDLLHPVISGNKWRKLKYILQHAVSFKTRKIISMGGAYSNHLHALAYAGHELGLETLGIIRGERPEVLNPSLRDMREWGMALEFVSRSDYRQLRTYKQYQALPGLNPGEYWLPEGGALNLALQGVAELVAEIKMDYDVLCVPCGTATTMAGLVKAVAEQKQVHGFAALKGAGFLTDELDNFLEHSDKLYPDWSIHLQYHFGGFAKITPELLHFIQQFEQTHHIKLEPVYTGKMLYGIYDLIRQGYFKSGLKIIAIHTGGLQGNRGFESASVQVQITQKSK